MIVVLPSSGFGFGMVVLLVGDCVCLFVLLLLFVLFLLVTLA